MSRNYKMLRHGKLVIEGGASAGLRIDRDSSSSPGGSHIRTNLVLAFQHCLWRH